jgi:hypothetical protein
MLCHINADFDILDFDAFNGEIKNAFSGSPSDGRGNVRVGHQLQDGYASSATGLLHPSQGLLDCFATCFEVSLPKLRHL